MVKTHIKLWIIFLFLALLVVPAILPPEMAQARLESEHDSSVAIFGQQRVDAITSGANLMYQKISETLGLERFIRSGFVKRKDVEGQVFIGTFQGDMSTFTNQYLLSLMLQIYGIFFRGALMLQWMIYIGFFLFASLFDGIVQRKVKHETLQVVSPLKFAIAMNTVVAVFFMPLAYLLLPAHVTPWFMPIWAVVVALPLSKAISNAARTN